MARGPKVVQIRSSHGEFVDSRWAYRENGLDEIEHYTRLICSQYATRVCRHRTQERSDQGKRACMTSSTCAGHVTVVEGDPWKSSPSSV